MSRMTPGKLLKMAIFESGEQQQKIADMLNVSPGTLSKYCSDYLEIPSDKIGLLSKTLVGQTQMFKLLQKVVLQDFLRAINYKSTSPDRKPPGGAGAMMLPKVA